MSMSTTPVSSWKAAAARFAAQRSQAPAAPPPEDNPPLTPPVRPAVEAAINASLDRNSELLTELAVREARASVALDGETVPLTPEQFAATGGLDPQPEAPSPEPAADKPKGRRGRPPGSKNKTAKEATTAEGLLAYELTPEQSASLAEVEQEVEAQIAADEERDLSGYAFDVRTTDGGIVDLRRGRTQGKVGGEPAPTFRDFTLSEIAAVAKATGAEISIHFSGKVA